ncbi:MAG: class I SAM-dependent methyltransferase [Nanoarchaeota archaeon]
MNTDIKKFVRFCESNFGQSILKKESEYIYQELKDCQKILDVGCGIGSFEQKLFDLNIIGLDSSAKMLKEARKRSNKTFVLGNAENLPFSNCSFDAVFYVATLEFLNNYQKAIQEAKRVTKPNGKLLVMMLNPESKYFHEHAQKENSYFKRIKHTNTKKIKNYVSQYYNIIEEEYFLGIKKEKIFDSSNKRFAGLYVIVGKKNS